MPLLMSPPRGTAALSQADGVRAGQAAAAYGATANGASSRDGGVPTLLVFKAGSVVKQRVGAAPKSALAELINSSL